MAAAHVQHGFTRQFGGSTVAVVLNGVVTGNALGVWVQWRSITVTLTSITVSGGNSNMTRVNNTVGGDSTACFGYLANVTGGNLTITANFSADPSNWEVIMAHEASGVVTSGLLDVSTLRDQADPGEGTNAITSLDVTTTQGGDYCMGAAGELAGFGGTLAAGTDVAWTLRVGGGANSHATESFIQATAGAIDGVFTQTGGGAFEDFMVGIMTFKAASAAANAPSVNDAATLAEAQTMKMSFYTGAINDAPTVTESQTMHMPISLRMEKLT